MLFKLQSLGFIKLESVDGLLTFIHKKLAVYSSEMLFRLGTTHKLETL